jgi:hypothetical protein
LLIRYAAPPQTCMMSYMIALVSPFAVLSVNVVAGNADVGTLGYLAWL